MMHHTTLLSFPSLQTFTTILSTFFCFLVSCFLNLLPPLRLFPASRKREIYKMGLTVSCSGEAALDDGFDALLMRSLSFDGGNVKPNTRSVSFNGRDAEPTILKSFGSGKLIIKGSLSFKKEEEDSFGQLETKISIKSPKKEEGSVKGALFRTSRFNPSNERAPVEGVNPDGSKFQAAVKLQKVYKSFRTRRQLADCAVLVEQRWWKLLDFALLKQSSVSFFDVEEPESAVSKWLRARRRAATVGKGLSKDEKAQKLALQHWLEAIDPRHRYGHNLHFYYDCWLHCASREPFFYWLDLGEGKEVNLEDKCTRAKLQHQCIKYLGPKEREAYEVIAVDGKLMYKQSGKLLDTSEGPKDSKWIFVLSTSKYLYVGQKKKGNFQHSSFLAGGATSAAGRLVVDSGILKAVWPHSGHYRPTERNFQEFVTFLKDNNVELTDVQLSPTEGDDEMPGAKSFRYDLDSTQTAIPDEPETVEPEPKDSSSYESSNGSNKTLNELKFEGFKRVRRSISLEQYHKLHAVDMDESDDEADREANFERPNELDSSRQSEFRGCEMEDPTTSDGHYIFRKQNLFLEEQEENEEASVPQEAILRRINSKKGMKSYQLGKQLSCKWTTGAGPRIGWVRDYPSELQSQALEQVHLSPRAYRPQHSMQDQPVSSPRIAKSSILHISPALEQFHLSPRSDRPQPSLQDQPVSSPRMAKTYILHMSPRSDRQCLSPVLQPVAIPTMREVPLLGKVPLLQKPNICRL